MKSIVHRMPGVCPNRRRKEEGRMKYGTVRGLDKPVSRLVLGTMIISSRDRDRSFALLDAAWEHGIRAFDTAVVYGGGASEEGLGMWLRERNLGKEAVVISKGCHPAGNRKRVTPEDLAADIELSLNRLGLNCIDVYMLHRDDPSVPVGPIVEAFNEHLNAGRIKAFGGSNWTHARIREANDYAASRNLVPFAVSSPNFGLAEQVRDPWGPGCVSISGQSGAEAREWYRRENIAVFAYSSLGRGLFSGRITRDNYETAADQACRTAYCHEVNFKRLDRARELAARRGMSVAQIALAYVLNQDFNVFALVGAASREECAANEAASELSLTRAEMEWLDLRRDTI